TVTSRRFPIPCAVRGSAGLGSKTIQQLLIFRASGGTLRPSLPSLDCPPRLPLFHEYHEPDASVSSA
ncbi:unnamed protein product, partial [Musa textilis]